MPIGNKLALLLKKAKRLRPTARSPRHPRSSQAAKGDTTAPPEREPARDRCETANAGGRPSGKAASSERIKASPLAKKIAAAEGIELSNISGTGPGGRIVAKDLEKGKAAGGARSAAIRPGTRRHRFHAGRSRGSADSA